MRFLIGLAIGALIISYWPTAGENIRAVTHSAAQDVSEHTQPTMAQQLEEALGELQR